MATTLRQPRLRATADGQIISCAESAQVISTAHATADRFRLTLAPGALAVADWADLTDELIEISFSLDGASWFSLIVGNVDQLRLAPSSGQVVLEGRDLSARLIDSRIEQTFANQTSSDIASQFAADAGLDANIATTSTPVGAYWQLEHDQIMLAAHCRARSRWDLVVQLAAREGFDVWVSNTSLNFQPSDQSNIVEQSYAPSDFLRLSLERSLTIARDISINVQSWNSREARMVSQTAVGRRGGTIASSGSPLSYTFLLPNLTASDAQSIAEQRLSELTRHERVLDAEMPGELSLAPRQKINLIGTQSGFDQSYWIDTITRRLSVQGGFTQILRARSASPGLTISEA